MRGAREQIGDLRGLREALMARRRGFTRDELAELGYGLDGERLERPPAKACRRAVHHPGQMNKTEERYARHLDLLKATGRIVDYAFEPCKLRLGVDWKTTLLVDFMVLMPDGTIEMREVKGRADHWEDDARAKIKMAARLYPFRFVGVHERPKKQGGGWAREVFPPEKE